MADYKYIGLTAYIELNEKTEEKLSILAEAIDPIIPHVTRPSFDEADYENVMSSDEYQFIYDNASVCYPDKSELPKNTPDFYQRAAVDPTNIKGVPMLRLYVPAVAKDGDRIKQFMNALPHVLSALFQSDLVSVKTKEGIEYDDFQDLKETVLVSVNDRTAVIA